MSFDRECGTLRNFLIGVMPNLVFKQLRKVRLFDELEQTAICEPIDPVGRGARVDGGTSCLQAPPPTKGVLILAVYEGMILEEITRVTGAELAAVKSRLHLRART